MQDHDDDLNARLRAPVSLWDVFILALSIFIFLTAIGNAKFSENRDANFSKIETQNSAGKFSAAGSIGSIVGGSRTAGAGARLSVYDGDTFTLDGERIRIAAIDTPERSTPQCDAERRLARLARLRLIQLLGNGSGIALEREPLPDRYGRTLARVTVNGVDVAPVLIREGLAVKWEGKRHSWCCG